MTVISSHKDPKALTLTLVAEFGAPVERVWRVWEDPRRLERWWGPPTWPATFEQHDFKVGGRSRYHMTGPEGEKAGGWWEILALDAPNRLEFADGFADDNGEPNPAMPTTRCVVTLEATGTGTRMTTVSHFASAEDLERLITMGMEEGMKLAAGQIDALLAETTV
ncbi:SRPBCC domain-containing protein [Amycolatopsis sp. K13G38]|uniref:SRPBCC domain-containing protein n=1 Tax=Amycolatopsis acididurans TaxID=2724524 RepID=A0ABX1J279_9PSEU|nr:SRPBCC domain-containing protein [Amycolatopsis acididurans]NKQ53471.1 SRPBCC domain-containing protein [Amycolatopsis acididurans]